jgi:hypothetical protein
VVLILYFFSTKVKTKGYFDKKVLCLKNSFTKKKLYISAELFVYKIERNYFFSFFSFSILALRPARISLLSPRV